MGAEVHEPRLSKNVRAHIRDGKPEWRQGHSVPKKGLGTHHMDKTGRKTGNQWATKAGNDKEDTYAMVCILLKSIGAPGGIEPTARSLEGCCSIQLSYWRKYGSNNL